MSISSNCSENIGKRPMKCIIRCMLAYKKLVTSESDYTQDSKFSFPIKKVLCKEKPNKHQGFVIDSTLEKVNVFENGEYDMSLDRTAYEQKVLIFYEEISDACNKFLFSAKYKKYFINSFGYESVVGLRNNKTDSIKQVHELQTYYESVSVFSIQSNVGSPLIIAISLPGDAITNNIYNHDYSKNYHLESTKFERGFTERSSFASFYKANGFAYSSLTNECTSRR